MSKFRIKIRHLDALARSLRWSPSNDAGRYIASAYIDRSGSVEIVFTDTRVERKAFTVKVEGFDWLDVYIAYHDPIKLQCIAETNVNIMRQLEGAINLMMEMDDV